MIGISGSLILSKTLMELTFNPCGEFREVQFREPKSTLHLHAGSPGIFSDLSRSVQMLKSEWGAENIPIKFKTAILVPEFAVESLPLDRTAALCLSLQ